MILSRLKNAIREQNWFAVVLEVLIVIVGVVVGFQITIWGQGRANASREHGYLVQLADDLQETVANFESVEFVRLRDQASARLVQAFRTTERPPPDSIFTWVHLASRLDRPFVVAGTADALVETGDINLIRDDSLRSAITEYLDMLQLFEGYLDSNSDRATIHVENLSRHIDYGEALLAVSSREDSVLAVLGTYPIPEGHVLTPFPLDVDAFLTNREAYTAIWNIWRRRYLMHLNRHFIERETSDLLDLVQSELHV